MMVADRSRWAANWIFQPKSNAKAGSLAEANNQPRGKNDKGQKPRRGVYTVAATAVAVPNTAVFTADCKSIFAICLRYRFFCLLI